MPIFEYECTQCGERTEHLQLSSDAPLEACPQCGGAVRKLMSAPAFQFKGTGWYVTDYAGKGKAGEGSRDNGSEKASETSGDSGDSKKSSGSAPAAESKASSAKSSSAKASSPSD